MKKYQESIVALAMITVFVAVSVFLLRLAAAGDLEAPAVPSDNESAMYTIEDLYDYLDTGLAGAKRTGGFVEPGSGPGSTGGTLDEVHAKITEKCITCEGTLNGTRWCDQGNGTVKDMTTGLVWLQDASWGGLYPWWASTIDGTDAHTRVTEVKNGTPSTLTDGSENGVWRLPTLEELYGLAHGTDAVSVSNPRAFTGLAELLIPVYWSSTTYGSNTGEAWVVFMWEGTTATTAKDDHLIFVWPVRPGDFVDFYQ